MGVFSAEEACEIHVALLGDVIERAARASPTAALSVAWSETLSGACGACAAADPLPPGVAEETQSGGDLGERMALAIQAKLRAGHKRVVILGSDSPTLPADHLTGAFEALRRAEVVLGPAEDGGYYLIGMTRLHLEPFRGIRWGTRDVFPVTIRRLKESGVSFVEIGVWHDVDTPEDALRLWKDLLRMKERRASDLPQRTYRVLARLAPGRIAV